MGGVTFLLVGVIKADSVRGGASDFISWLKYLTEEKPESLSTVTRARPRSSDRLLLEDWSISITAAEAELN